MKGLTGALFFLLIFVVKAGAQYYYKDIILTRQSIENRKAYQQSRIRSVKLNSFESNGQPTEGFQGEQTISNDYSTIITSTSSTMSTASVLTSFYDANGLLKKTIDTSDTYQSTTEYSYNASNQVQAIVNTALQTDNKVSETEQHIWSYDANGRPAGMLKIKNNNDTTYLKFIADEKGNIVEERAVRNNANLPVVYYYYNENNQLTDIVHFDERTRRLLPDYVFEYDAQGRPSSMLVVPKGSSNYQRWVYEYNEKGLKSTESCYNKKKELLGRVEYQYSYSK